MKGIQRGRRRATALAAIMALLLMAITPSVTLAAASITLMPTRGSPGSTVKVIGSGYAAGENVAISFDSTAVTTASTSSSGAFVKSMLVPARARPGAHTITARGQTSGRSAQATFRVTPDWPMFRYNAARTGYDPYETAISTANVAGLSQSWRASPIDALGSSVAVANDVAYIGTFGRKLRAYSAKGITNCSGTPRLCEPLWTATVGGPVDATPAVANGVVYLGSQDGYLYAFDARGITNCSMTPKVCAPLWYAQTSSFIESSPVVSGGRVFVGSYDHSLYAFDARGITNCVPVGTNQRSCSPLWTAVTGDSIYSSPAVSRGVVYVGSYDNKLYAFDAAGVSGCSGSPKVCQALWVGSTNGDILATPSVKNGVVYVGSMDAKLYAFSAGTGAACDHSVTPATCAPLWTAQLGGGAGLGTAVANGLVFTGSYDRRLYAFDAGGATNCAGTPKVCQPVWSSSPVAHAMSGPPSVANGLVYIGSYDSGVFEGTFYAYRADGSGCPTAATCAPLWSFDPGNYALGSPALAGGLLYLVGSNTLYALKP